MNIHCFDIKCSPILMDFSENYCLKKEPQSSDINNEKFYIHLNLNNLNNIMKLDFSGGKIQMINFLSDECLTNLEELNLSNNKIEDISFLTEQNIKCKKITKVNLSENPVRKGLEVLNQKFFTDRYLYIEVFNVIEKEDEYFISLNFQDPLWDSCVIKSRDKKIGFKEFYLDIYLKDLNHLWNYVDEKYTFFSNGLLRLQKLGLIKEEDYNLKYEIFAFLTNLPNFFHTLYYDSKTKDILLNFSELLFDKGYYFLNELFIINMMDNNYNDSIYYFENPKKYEINIYSLCDYSFKDFIDFKSREYLDFSDSKIPNVKFLAGIILLNNLRILKICNKSYIQNLYLLKNAKFVNLEELYLSNDNLEDLNDIEMDKYPFENLKILDLSRNNIYKIEPVLHFKNLRELNLSYNKIFPSDANNLIQTLKCTIDLRGAPYACHSGNKDIFANNPNVLY